MRALLLAIVMLLLVQAPSVSAASWLPTADAVGDMTYAGSVDQPGAGASVAADQQLVVSGWFVDQTAQGWSGVDDVQVFDGVSGAGGTFLGRASIGLPRPDVAQALANGFWAASGFSASVSPLAAGPHTLSVYAHTPSKGWWYTQVSVTASAAAPGSAAASTAAAPIGTPPVNSLVAPAASEKVSRKLDTYTIRGFAYDPTATSGTGVDRVQVYMDEPRGQGGMFVGDAQFGGSTPSAAARYGPRFAEAGYRIDIGPENFTAGNHHIFTYARSSVTGLETEAVVSFDMFNP
jgi:hypothetical protein